MRGVAKENVNFRYAATFESLTTICSEGDVSHMLPLLPLVKDIFETEQRSDTFKSARRSLENLLKTKCIAAVMDAILQAKIIEALVSRMKDPSVAIVQTCLSAVGMLADNSNIEHMMRLDVVLPYLTNILELAAGGMGNDRVALKAMQCIRKICQASTHCVDMVADVIPEVFNALVVIVNKAQNVKHPCGNAVAVQGATALMLAAKYITDVNILDQIGIYTLTFQIISIFHENVDVVDVALSALQRLMLDKDEVSNRQALAERSRSFSAINSWNTIAELAEEYESDTENDEKDKSVANSTAAKRIWKNAKTLKLIR